MIWEIICLFDDKIHFRNKFKDYRLLQKKYKLGEIMKEIDIAEIQVKYEPLDDRQPYRLHYKDTILAFAKDEKQVAKLIGQIKKGER